MALKSGNEPCISPKKHFRRGPIVHRTQIHVIFLNGAAERWHVDLVLLDETLVTFEGPPRNVAWINWQRSLPLTVEASAVGRAQRSCFTRWVLNASSARFA